MTTSVLAHPESAVDVPPRALVHRAWRASAAAVLWLPVSVIGLFGSLIGLHRRVAWLQWRLVVYGTGERHEPAKRGPLPVLASCFLGIPLGALSLFIGALASLNTIRCVFLYGAFGGSTENAWGGPTLVGAWVVHALLALALLPVLVGLLWLIGRLQAKLSDALLGAGRGGLVAIPAALLFAAGGTAFFVAWLHQL